MAAIKLPPNASMADYQHYVHELEAMHGWLDVDLVHSGFLMTEEVGELFKAIRNHQRLFRESTGASVDEPTTEEQASEREKARAQAAEEVADVLNYLLAIANRLNIDVEDAFRRKNAKNQQRTWE